MAQIFSQPFFPDGFHLRKEKEDGIPWAIWAHLSLPVEGWETLVARLGERSGLSWYLTMERSTGSQVGKLGFQRLHN
jgi:hypothetical protein